MDTSINERVNLPATRKTQGKNEVYLVSVHVRDLLNVRRLQGRLTVRQTAALLNCGEHDLPVLAKQGLLCPLGNPPPGTQKYYSPVEVLELAGNAQRMGEICDVLYRHWQIKNAAKTKKSPGPNGPSNGNGSRSRRLPRN
jgi:hypothetical protein